MSVKTINNTYTYFIHMSTTFRRNVSGQLSTVSQLGISKQGYTFNGWSLTNGGAKRYNDGDIVTFNKDTDLYAVWTENSLIFYGNPMAFCKQNIFTNSNEYICLHFSESDGKVNIVYPLTVILHKPECTEFIRVIPSGGTKGTGFVIYQDDGITTGKTRLIQAHSYYRTIPSDDVYTIDINLRLYVSCDSENNITSDLPTTSSYASGGKAFQNAVVNSDQTVFLSLTSFVGQSYTSRSDVITPITLSKIPKTTEDITDTSRHKDVGPGYDLCLIQGSNEWLILLIKNPTQELIDSYTSMTQSLIESLIETSGLWLKYNTVD